MAFPAFVFNLFIGNDIVVGRTEVPCANISQMHKLSVSIAGKPESPLIFEDPEQQRDECPKSTCTFLGLLGVTTRIKEQ